MNYKRKMIAAALCCLCAAAAGCADNTRQEKAVCSKSENGMDSTVTVYGPSSDDPVSRVELDLNASLTDMGLPAGTELSSAQVQTLMSAYLGQLGLDDTGMKAEVEGDSIHIQFTMTSSQLEKFGLGAADTPFKDVIDNARQDGYACS